QQGGETPIADTRKVWELLSDNTRRKFLEKGILYTRNIGTGFGLNWKEVFQTTDRGKVEEYCQKNGIQFEWKGAAQETITIKFSRPAVRLHPATGARVWFNHSYLFSIYSFPEFIQKIFRSNPDAIPFSSQYGDGSEIEKEVIEEIESIYNRLMVAFTWQKGDILLLDNMLTAHGRKPYKGERKILVGMLDPCS
ncbi:MAG: TauD/TfdA family dioxygenase, partial [Cytophagales bacterium]|nr:TauD/TfdA family dioxygenase [Cytophagales bacterium]